MAQPIVGNCYTFTLQGITKYIGRCIGITYADSERSGLFNTRLVAYFLLNDDKSKNICDYKKSGLIEVFVEDFVNLNPVDCQKITDSASGSGNSSASSGGRRRTRKTRKSRKAQKARKAKKVKKQSRRRV